MSAESKPFFVSLPHRGLIHLEGQDRHELLQNLITNDINDARPGHMLYTAMLSAQGKFLHDFFIREGEDFTLLECTGGDEAQAIYKKLKMYKLRMDVQLSVEDNVPVYAILTDADADALPATALPDPRHSAMGARGLEKPADMDEKPFDLWDEHRIKLGVPDGRRDMEANKDTALECNLDKLYGVSFEKGCYIGQEITARMHLRNILKNRLYTVRYDSTVPEPFTDLTDQDGKRIGQARSHCGKIGLAMLKIEAAKAGAFNGFEIVEDAISA